MLQTEAVEFLENVLKIEEIASKLKFSKLELMREICMNIQQNIPFQNLSMLATDASDRHLPTTDEIQEAFFTKVGGVCFSGACFAQQLFAALGFVTFLVSCNITGKANKRSFTHAACVVKDAATSDERFFVDFASGFPTFEPVPLHLLPQFYHHAFLQYKFERLKSGSIVRLHKVDANNSNELPSLIEDGWQPFYDFQEIPRDEEFLKPYHAPIYTDPKYGTWFLKGLKISFYPENQAYSINDYLLKKWRKGMEVESVHLHDVDDLQEAIKKYFPTLAKIDVHKAVFNWNESKLIC